MSSSRTADGQEPSVRSKLKSVFNRSAVSAVAAWCRPVRGTLGLACLFGVLATLASLCTPLVTRELVDSAVGGSADLLWKYGLLLAAVILLTRLFSFLYSYLQTKAAAAFQLSLQQTVSRELFSRDYASLRPYHSGELVNRLFSDAAVVKNGVTSVLPTLLRTAVSFIGAAVLLTAMDWRFVPVMLACSLLWAGLSAAFRRPMKQRHKRMQKEEDLLHAVSQETLENIRVVKAGRSEGKTLGLIRRHAEELRNAQMSNGLLAVFMKTGIAGVMDLSWLLCYVWGCVKIFRGEFTYGSLAALISLVGRIQNPVANAANLLGQLYGIAASAERLQEVLDLPEDRDLGTLEDFQRITLDHVSFRYEDKSPEVLRDACGEIRKGDRIALTGRSGEGKTSLFQLLLGIYRPTSGSVVFSDGSQSLPASRGTRSLFSYVPQGNTLFSGTLRDNLTLFSAQASETVPDEEIFTALRIACIDDLAEEIGLDAVLGENGIGLSEGQAQRVAVARALLSRAPVLLLDEATSALDDATEAKLLKNIAELSSRGQRELTVIIVTHRHAAEKICTRRWRIGEGRLFTDPEEQG